MSFAFTFSFGFRLGFFWPLFAARAFIFRPSLWAGRGREREGGGGWRGRQLKRARDLGVHKLSPREICYALFLCKAITDPQIQL